MGKIAALYCGEPFSPLAELEEDLRITVDISLTKANNTYEVQFSQSPQSAVVIYLTQYNYFREVIEFYNFENPLNQIPPLFESFALIGSYRNYHAFSEGVSLSGQPAEQQIQTLRVNENSRSTNGTEQVEPAIFSLVRLLIAGFHFERFGTHLAGDAERLANEQSFLKKINGKLAMVGLMAEVKLISKQTWQYSFAFIDIKRKRKLVDINSLSAGQKAIIHLVFEAYGRGELKGGVVVIDEPEIHLHYQFQHEYLRIIEEINKEQSCQYILVTHSESLINSNTINKVRRFALSADGYSVIKSPIIEAGQKELIKILDNTRSTYAFFSKKVVLVEGDSDRYLFKAILQEQHPELMQEIAFLDIGGKGNYMKWKSFFEMFGLMVYYIGDFDNVITMDFVTGRLIEKSVSMDVESRLKQQKLNSLSETQVADFSIAFRSLDADTEKLCRPNRALWKPVLDKFVEFVKLKNGERVQEIKRSHPSIVGSIESKYAERIYLLKHGAIEDYIGGNHADLNHIINFCSENLKAWLKREDEKVMEIKSIFNCIASEAA
jgi:hypothetical protein